MTRRGKVLVVADVSSADTRDTPLIVSPAVCVICKFAPMSVIAKELITTPEDVIAILNNMFGSSTMYATASVAA
jgi:malic enzyme